MQRRRLLIVGGAIGALVALAGATLGVLRPARVEGRFSVGAGMVMARVAQAVLDGFLSAEPRALAAQLQAHLLRLQATGAWARAPATTCSCS